LREVKGGFEAGKELPYALKMDGGFGDQVDSRRPEIGRTGTRVMDRRREERKTGIHTFEFNLIVERHDCSAG
jgi:hypothetical protein